MLRLIAAFLLVSFSCYIGYSVGRGFNRIDLDTFDVQAQIIRDLSRQLSEEHPDDPRYHIIE